MPPRTGGCAGWAGHGSLEHTDTVERVGWDWQADHFALAGGWQLLRRGLDLPSGLGSVESANWWTKLEVWAGPSTGTGVFSFGWRGGS